MLILVLLASCTSEDQVDENPTKSAANKQKEDSLWRSYLSSNEETAKTFSVVTVRENVKTLPLNSMIIP
jgi:hypothetical protein